MKRMFALPSPVPDSLSEIERRKGSAPPKKYLDHCLVIGLAPPIVSVTFRALPWLFLLCRDILNEHDCPLARRVANRRCLTAFSSAGSAP